MTTKASHRGDAGHGPCCLWSRVSADTILAAVDSYENYVGAELVEVESERREKIPRVLHQQKPEGMACISKKDMMALVEWKSKQKSTPYRMKLIKLAEENSEESVEHTSREAFQEVAKDPCQALQVLTRMRGIGPATASLILSCYDPVQLPFFSDPLFRWFHLEETSTGQLKGWDRAIKYNIKEYKSLYDRVDMLRARLKDHGQDITASQLEKAAVVFYHKKSQDGIKEARSHKRKTDEYPKSEARAKRIRPKRVGTSKETTTEQYGER